MKKTMKKIIPLVVVALFSSLCSYFVFQTLQPTPLFSELKKEQELLTILYVSNRRILARTLYQWI